MVHKAVEMRREALFFTVFFLTAAVIWLLAAVLLLLAAKSGACDYCLAVRYLPAMLRSSLLSVPLAVCGGLIFDLHLRG